MNTKEHWEMQISKPPVQGRGFTPDRMDHVVSRISEHPVSTRKRWVPIIASSTAAVAVLAVLAFSSRDLMKSNFHSGSLTAQASQSLILDKMRNGYMKYQTVQGTFKQTDRNTGTSQIEFQAHQGQQHASYVKVTTNNGFTKETIFTDQYMMSIQNGEINQVALTQPEGQDRSGLTPVPASIADKVLNPLQGYSTFLADPSAWSTVGMERLLNRDVTKIQGHLPTSLRAKLHAETFSLWIDDATGIILKEETVNGDGKQVEGLEVTSVTFNSSLDESLFVIPKEQIDKATAYQHNAIVTSPVIDSITDDEVPSSLRRQWEIAKQSPEKTTILHDGDNWYVIPKRGLLVSSFDVNKNQGTVTLATGQNSHGSGYRIHAGGIDHVVEKQQ